MAHIIAVEADVDKVSMRERAFSVLSERASQAASGRRAARTAAGDLVKLQSEANFVLLSTTFYYADESSDRDLVRKKTSTS
jgi:hypothetical protein